MKALSDLLEIPQKPDPDLMSNWLQSAQTQWLLKTLYIEHQELSESLEGIDADNQETEAKHLHIAQGGLRSMRFVINLIEEAKNADKDV